MRLILILSAILALSGCGNWNHHADDLWRVIPPISNPTGANT